MNMADRIPDPDPKMVGQRLDALREALGIEDQQDFAVMIGIDPSSYTKVKNGRKPLKSDVAYRAAERFGVTMDFFYRGRLADMDETLRATIVKILGGQKR